MAKHSISEAARLAGVSRSHFYKKYVRPGLISVERDKDDKPVIDTAEIMRACGALAPENGDLAKTIQFDTHVKDSKIATLEAEVQLWRELSKEKDNRIADLQQAINRLEHRPVEPRRGFWSRVFGG
jgi:hypothetical protein